MVEVYVDGACYNQAKNVGGDIYAGIVITRDKKVVKRIGKPIGKGHSDNAENISILEALMNMPREYLDEEVYIYCDSQTVVGKINRYLSKEITIEAIKVLEQNSEVLCEIIKLMREFKNLKIKWIDRNRNTMAHNLAQGTANGFQENLIDIDLVGNVDNKFSSLCNINISNYDNVEDLLELSIGELINTIVAQKADNSKLSSEMNNLKSQYKQLEETAYMLKIEKRYFNADLQEDNVIEVNFNRFLC